MVGAEVIGKDLADDFRLNSRSRRAAQASEVLSLLDGRDSGFASGVPVSELLDSWVIPKKDAKRKGVSPRILTELAWMEESNGMIW